MDELAGLWGCERTLGPEIRGELTVVNEGIQWRACIAGFEASSGSADGDALSFVFAGSRGEFRGHVEGDSKIIGHWIQPGGIVGGNTYATLVELASQGQGEEVWRGEVVPLDDRLALYLVIEAQPEGSMSAFIRDPERNAGLWLRIDKVLIEGETVRMDTAQGEITGKYDKVNGTLSIVLPFYPATLDFTKRSRDEAAGFYPRTPGLERYFYRQPLIEDDGWETGSLADAGLDPQRITALVEQILGTQTTGVRTPYIQGLLIARHGRLVLEEYFYGFHKDRPHDLRSASKSLAGALVGLTIDKGGTLDVTTPVRSFFPEYTEYANDDPRKRRMTVEHLLTMTSGLECDDNDDSSPGNEDVMHGQEAQPDWYKYALDLRIVREPGQEAVYCSAGMNLVGGVVSRATAAWLPDFFHEHFALPLNFRRYHLLLMPPPLGNMYTGGGSYMRPRDFMKLGQLFLAGGRWNGKQVISQEWVERSLQAHSHFEDHDYGYSWHLGEYTVAGRTYHRAEAGGNGGQFVIIVPELDLVVMFTAANYGNYPTWSKFRDQLVPEFIIPAALK